MAGTDARPSRPERPAGRRRARWARRGALLAAGGLVSAVFGVTTASVEQSLGPHEARYSVTTDDLVTVDLGPLGTVEIDSPLPLTLGVDVRVEEIPRSVTAVDPARTVQALGQDLAGYVQFFTSPRATLADAARALVTDALVRTLLCLLLLTAAVVGGEALLGPARRRELAAALAPHRGDLLRGSAIAVVVGVLCVSSVRGAVPEPPAGRPSPVFDGTPLEGARITGRLAGVVDTYGSVVADAYRDNEAFYRAAQAEVAAAWDQRAQAIAARAESAERRDELIAAPLLEPTADPAEAVEPVVVLLVSDLHCNVGMARVIRTVAERSGADLVLNAGDTTVNGTSVERYCVTAFGAAVPDGVPKVVADGNHDSLQTAGHERDAGWTVLEGGVVEVAGLRVLGDRDPNQTQIGGGTTSVAGETSAEAGRRLAEVACDDGAVDLLLIHTPRVGDAALESGCVPVQLSGHEHRRTGPVAVGQGVRYVSSTTAGATSGGATIGPLNGVASLTVLRWDPRERRMVDLQVVEVAPDGTATVGPREPWPRPGPLDADGAAPDGDGTSTDGEPGGSGEGGDEDGGPGDGGGTGGDSGGGIPDVVPGPDDAADTPGEPSEQGEPGERGEPGEPGEPSEPGAGAVGSGSGSRPGAGVVPTG